MLVYKWNAASGHYALQSTIVPSGPTQWYPDDLAGESYVDASTRAPRPAPPHPAFCDLCSGDRRREHPVRVHGLDHRLVPAGPQCVATGWSRRRRRLHPRLSSPTAVSIYSLVDGSVAADYTTPLNTQLQTSATVRMDRNYCGGARACITLCCLSVTRSRSCAPILPLLQFAVWGDTGLGDNVPTAVLLQAGASTPVFTYVTPGSNFGLDVVVGEQVC